MWPSAEDRHVHRCGGCCCVSCGLVGPVQKETVAPTNQFKTVLASVRGEGGEAPAADQRQEEKNPCCSHWRS